MSGSKRKRVSETTTTIVPIHHQPDDWLQLFPSSHVIRKHLHKIRDPQTTPDHHMDFYIQQTGSASPELCRAGWYATMYMLFSRDRQRTLAIERSASCVVNEE
jgi:hypothetical protein